MVAATHTPGTGGFTTPTLDELALLFPEFSMRKLLGRGGMGVVYEAEQPALERTVAIKILPPEIAGGDGELAERFRREAAVLARLDHPHIVTIYDFGERGGFIYFVMEYVHGTDLAQRMAAGQIPREESLRIAGDICDALHYSHGRGVVHRDIKPANILVALDGTVKIADFGLAKLVHPDDAHLELTRSSASLGTPRYMAPEQLAGAKDTDHRVDIYALGVVLYELLTGHYPAGKIGVPSESNPEVHPLFDDVVLRALSQEPETRYADASEVKTALRDASEGRGFTRQQRARRTAWKRLFISVAASVLGAGLALIFLIGKDTAEPPLLILEQPTYKLESPGVAPVERAASISISSSDSPFIVAIDSTSQVIAWGDNRFGQAAPPVQKALAVAAACGPSGAHAIALRSDGTISGWGDDTYGQATPPHGLSDVAEIAVGQFFSVARTAAGKLVSWGKIAPPPADLLPATSIAAGADFYLALCDGEIRVIGDLAPCPEDSGFIAIAAGDGHALALRNDGTVLAWGENSQDQCEIPNDLPPAAKIVAGGDGSAIITSGGRVITWGNAPASERFEGKKVAGISIGSEKEWAVLLK